MAAGEAHWQVGIVERHIGVLKEVLTGPACEEKGGFGSSPSTAGCS